MAKTRIDYRPREILSMSGKEMRKAYSNMRDIARKRAGRIRAAGYGESYATMTFPKLKEIQPHELAGYLAEISRYLRTPSTTLSGYRATRKRTLERLHSEKKANGRPVYNFIDEQNLDRFSKFMERARERADNHKLKDSVVVAEIFNEAERLKMRPTVLERKFRIYTQSEEKKYQLLEALQSMNARSRATSANDVLNQMGVDFDYFD